jgi:hypothetical protein
MKEQKVQISRDYKQKGREKKVSFARSSMPDLRWRCYARHRTGTRLITKFIHGHPW